MDIEIIKAELDLLKGELQVTEKAHKNLTNLLNMLDKQLMLGGVSKCNAVKDPNIVKTWLLISRDDGLTDVWHKGKCLGKGLNAEGINKLNL